MRTIVLIFTLTFFSCLLFSQNAKVISNNLLIQAYEYYKADDISRAIKTFKKAEKIDKENPYIHYYLCICYIEKKQKKKALVYYEQFKILAPKENEIEFDLRILLNILK